MIESPPFTDIELGSRKSTIRASRLQFFRWLTIAGGAVLILSALIGWRYIPSEAAQSYRALLGFTWVVRGPVMAVGFLAILLAGNRPRRAISGVAAGLGVLGLALALGFVLWAFLVIASDNSGIHIHWPGLPGWWVGRYVPGPGVYVSWLGTLVTLIGGIGLIAFRDRMGRDRTNWQ